MCFPNLFPYRCNRLKRVLPNFNSKRKQFIEKCERNKLEHVFSKFICKQNQKTDVSSRIRTSTNRTNIQMAWSDKGFYKQNQQTDIFILNKELYKQNQQTDVSPSIRSSITKPTNRCFLPE